jgi:hypothetical protein
MGIIILRHDVHDTLLQAMLLHTALLVSLHVGLRHIASDASFSRRELGRFESDFLRKFTSVFIEIWSPMLPRIWLI